ncbi:MAG: hypothetical protein Q7K54_04990 [Candidatus Parcubacteria bacterium]|nr:hypothetical protein [Candidatus Parcubacteria bacterium]
MPNRRKEKFRDVKMLSSRIEKEDYLKLEQMLESKNLSVQQFMNNMVRSFISGTVQVSGTMFQSK